MKESRLTKARARLIQLVCTVNFYLAVFAVAHLEDGSLETRCPEISQVGRDPKGGLLVESAEMQTESHHKREKLSISSSGAALLPLQHRPTTPPSTQHLPRPRRAQASPSLHPSLNQGKDRTIFLPCALQSTSRFSVAPRRRGGTKAGKHQRAQVCPQIPSSITAAVQHRHGPSLLISLLLETRAQPSLAL